MKYLLICTLLFSCYTPKKAEKELNKAITNYPELSAKITRDAFPCTDLKSDTLVMWQDSVIFVDCPDYSYPKRDTIIKVNILTNTVTKKVKVPVTIPAKTLYITKTVEDSAKILLAQAAKDKTVEALREMEDKNDTKKSVIWWLIILLLLSLGFNYLQAKKIV